MNPIPFNIPDSSYIPQYPEHPDPVGPPGAPGVPTDND